ncbi:hypothetical protein JJ691_48890 [Kutzneria sp. CA-103260]|nr:hypothetical protein JJ691_48890 [Kutzneria sp. CA-103260]
MPIRLPRTEIHKLDSTADAARESAARGRKSGPARLAVRQPKATPVVHLTLAPPTEQGTAVQLFWVADGDLDFAVVVAGEHVNTVWPRLVSARPPSTMDQ